MDLDGVRRLDSAVVHRVPLVALADAVHTAAAVRALGDELVVARRGWREFEEADNADLDSANFIAEARLGYGAMIITRAGIGASERGVLVEHDAVAVLVARGLEGKGGRAKPRKGGYSNLK